MSEKTEYFTEENLDNINEYQSKVFTANQKEYWIETAEENLQTAKSMLDTKRYLWAGFMCHLVVEKALKAVIAHITHELPPRSHKLIDLAIQGDIFSELTPDQITFLASLMPLYVEARYPSHKKEVSRSLNFHNCNDMCIKTEEFLSWIKKKL
jgi:HEPN domain-containing protein